MQQVNILLSKNPRGMARPVDDKELKSMLKAGTAEMIEPPFVYREVDAPAPVAETAPPPPPVPAPEAEKDQTYETRDMQAARPPAGRVRQRRTKKTPS